MIRDVIISFDSSVDGEKRSLQSLGDRRVEIASFLFAHVEDDVCGILNTPRGAILLDVLIQNGHFLRVEGGRRMDSEIEAKCRSCSCDGVVDTYNPQQ